MALRVFEREYSAAKEHLTGTHRNRSPAETLQHVQRMMGRFGITRLANITGLDCIGLPVYMAIRPNSRGLSTAQGKGIDVASAKVSALMESIECWHAERIEAPLRYESYLALREVAPVVDILALVRRPGADVHLDTPLLWIEGYDLLTCERRWVPFECVTTNFVRPPGSEPTFLVSSNGLASGNHLLEAILHGLCETAERDAVATWEESTEAELKSVQIDPASIDDESSRRVLDMLRAAHVEAAIWDASTPHLGIPTFVCYIFDDLDHSCWRPLGVFAGQGTHPAPEIALLRALTEAVQSRLTYISGSRDDVLRHAYDAQADPENLRQMHALAHAIPPRRRFSRSSSLATGTFEGDVQAILGALRRKGVENAVVVDLTKPGIDLPVIKVVVPGLRLPSMPTANSSDPSATGGDGPS